MRPPSHHAPVTEQGSPHRPAVVVVVGVELGEVVVVVVDVVAEGSIVVGTLTARQVSSAWLQFGAIP